RDHRWPTSHHTQLHRKASPGIRSLRSHAKRRLARLYCIARQARDLQDEPPGLEAIARTRARCTFLAERARDRCATNPAEDKALAAHQRPGFVYRIVFAHDQTLLYLEVGKGCPVTRSQEIDHRW